MGTHFLFAAANIADRARKKVEITNCICPINLFKKLQFR